MAYCNFCFKLKKVDEFYKSNKTKCKDCIKHYYQENREERINYQLKYLIENKEKWNFYQNNYKKLKYKFDPNFKIRCLLSIHFHRYFRGESNVSCMNYLGINLDAFKKWIEFQFNENMNWNNYGNYWEFDHVLPISRFNLTEENEREICFNWLNLKPLEVFKNRSKGNKLIPCLYLNQEIKAHYFSKMNR